ncbi:methyltransferase domain-containing protein [Clostridium bowmanii]|uniref:class I SAM-dependent methyltransferase n=1 Tax=Clostridium bowmanii TaxID=132925 RepID=UPI001C0B4E37|nr:class I SAM-dependent methyltransferase [Clostridium bowmanii]MBU3191869.1 methyltransferase domain-containing protein [Clostridium bowmanii]MCA1076141.1 methyltransferase domain-containing protein [Clostridium bowmanii]
MIFDTFYTLSCKVYLEQGKVQVDLLDTVVEAVDYFQQAKYKSVLDLGCGTGRNTIYLASRGFKVSACDISKTGIEITKKHTENLGFTNIDYRIEDMYKMTYDNNSFDAVLCIWVQGHGTKIDVQKGIDEIFRVLKKDETIVTDFVTIEDSTYGIGKEIEQNTFMGGRPGEEEIPHFYTSKEELNSMFSRYKNINIKDKAYHFGDIKGNEHIIKAAVVIAIK